MSHEIMGIDGKRIVVSEMPNGSIMIGEHDISMEDFLKAVIYVLENSDLKQDDPRLAFVNRIKWIGLVNGINEGNKRLG